MCVPTVIDPSQEKRPVGPPHISIIVVQELEDAPLEKLVVLVKDHDGPVDRPRPLILPADGVAEGAEGPDHDDVGVQVDAAVEIQNEESEEVGEMGVPVLTSAYLGQLSWNVKIFIIILKDPLPR